MENSLSNAQRYAESMDGDGPPSVYERNIERAKVFALIAIAEELGAIAQHADSIDSSLHTLQEVAQWSEAGKERTRELQQESEYRAYERSLYNS